MAHNQSFSYIFRVIDLELERLTDHQEATIYIGKRDYSHLSGDTVDNNTIYEELISDDTSLASYMIRFDCEIEIIEIAMDSVRDERIEYYVKYYDTDVHSHMDITFNDGISDLAI